MQFKKAEEPKQEQIVEESKQDNTNQVEKPPEKKWAKGVILVNDYQPPKEKTIEDFRIEVRERVKHLQLHSLPQASSITVTQKLQGKDLATLVLI